MMEKITLRELQEICYLENKTIEIVRRIPNKLIIIRLR